MAADVRIGQKEIARLDAYLPLGKFSPLRSFGANPSLPSSWINCDTSPDLISSNRYRAINVAAISRRLSAITREIAFPATLTSPVFGKFDGGSGKEVVTIGALCRALRRLGRFLNPPRNSSNAVGILGLAMWVPKF
jgi:hypothetical protein